MTDTTSPQPEPTAGPSAGPGSPGSGVPDPVINTGPPLQPEQPIEWEPGMWYSITVTCADNTCVPNYNRAWTIPQVQTGMALFCGVSNTPLTALTATLLDPQPVFEE